MSNYAFLSASELIVSYTHEGRWTLAQLNSETGKLTNLSSEFSAISSVHSNEGSACFIAATSASGQCVFVKAAKGSSQAVFPAFSLDKGMCAIPQAISFSVGDNEQSHGFYYGPSNAKYEAEGSPPMIVLCHGGPTGQNDSSLDLKLQYWTSRGFAVFDLNYRGSTGYGRVYRQSLYKNWGVLELEDLGAAVNHLCEQGLANTEQLIIKGSSAGGYSVLAALCFTDYFKAGVSLYGIGDLELLATDTHKFEKHYLDQLVGPYPEQKGLYLTRSPIHKLEGLNCPTLSSKP
jgi:dipeptidyl aminopeptidase/acylaminoacyl peptidase